jgi:hypothetical protein
MVKTNQRVAARAGVSSRRQWRTLDCAGSGGPRVVGERCVDESESKGPRARRGEGQGGNAHGVQEEMIFHTSRKR